MTNRKRVFWATTALFTGLMAAGAASAQSTGTEATEATRLGEVVVTGTRGPRNIDGLAVAETVAKTRNTVNQEFIATQTPGQTILQTLNLTPGLSFTNADPYGSSGGNIRLRGFDGNRVSLTFDGIPLNDTGNYATYTNQQLDPELIERASVNTGTTDVDSPTASATGGTINYVTRRPASEFGGWGQASFGSFDYQRFMFLIDTGEFGPMGTSAWFAYSGTDYDKFKGLGEIRKDQWNARVWQPLGDNGDGAADLVLAGTTVAAGRGTAVVFATGAATEFGGVARLARRFDLPVWLTYGTLSGFESLFADVDARVIEGYCAFEVGGIEVLPFPVPHDAREPAQFVFGDGVRRLGVLTDTGEATRHMERMLSCCDALVLECNHDPDMLRESSYPQPVKDRIAGRYGHLDNGAAAQLLASLDRSRLQHVVAAHLSQQNNRPELARAALGAVLGGDHERIRIAEQERGFDWIAVD